MTRTARDLKNVYPPLDTLKPVADGIFVVDSGPMHALGLTIPIRMTVVRLASGALWLHSPTPYREALRKELSKLGTIRHLIAPNIAHWMYMKTWQERCPESLAFAVQGLSKRKQVRKSGLRIDHALTDEAPHSWRGEIDQTMLRGRFQVTEAAFFHRVSRTLIVTDLIQNFERRKVGGVERRLLQLAGSLAPDGTAPIHLRLVMNANRSEVAAAAQRLMDWQPERIILSHGRSIETNGTVELRRRLRWLLDEASTATSGNTPPSNDPHPALATPIDNDTPKSAGQSTEGTCYDPLDEAVEETFPASDPIAPSRIDGPGRP